MFCDFATAGARAGGTAAERPSAGEGMISGAMRPKGYVFTAGSFLVRTHKTGPGLVVALRTAAASRGRKAPCGKPPLRGTVRERSPGFEDNDR